MTRLLALFLLICFCAACAANNVEVRARGQMEYGLSVGNR